VLAYDYAATREHVRPDENGFSAKFNDNEEFLGAACRVMARRAEWTAIRRAARATAKGIT